MYRLGDMDTDPHRRRRRRHRSRGILGGRKIRIAAVVLFAVAMWGVVLSACGSWGVIEEPLTLTFNERTF